MVYKGQFKIIDNKISACDYDFLLSKIDKTKKRLLISPVASQTLAKAHFSKSLRLVLDKFDYLVPDSQWVRWSMNFLYGKSLKDRVYGPELMLKIIRSSKKNIFLYGNTDNVLKKLGTNLKKINPSVNVTGIEPSKFRELEEKEWESLIEKIKESKAKIVFISLGSPKQEIFAYKLSKKIKIPLIIIPVGAAFNFISKEKPQAPKFLQRIGMEWFFRFLTEPRLFFRYFFFGPLFIFLILSQKLTLKFQNQG